MAQDQKKDTSQAAAAATAAPATGPRITFTAPYVPKEDQQPVAGDRRKAPSKTIAVATGMIEGLFVSPFTLLCAHEVKLTMNRAQRDLVVYLPAGGFGFSAKQHIGPRMIPLKESVMVAGREITHQDDPEAVKQAEKLKDAVKEAWVSMSGIPEAQRWGKTVPLVVR